MKNYKKTITILLVAAVLLIAVFMTGCTKQTQASNKDAALGTNFSDEEFAKLSALQFDGYEEMTVSEFQNKVWELTDTNEYRSLLERFSLDAALYEQKDSNALASFLFYTLEPLTAEKWQTRDFRVGTTTAYPGAVDNASLEFIYSLTVQHADTLTVGEYNAARLGVANGLQSTLQDKTKEQLKSDSSMQKVIDSEIEELKEQWDTDDLQISVKYFFMPLSELDAGNGKQENSLQGTERRENPNGTEEDYRSLLQLKTTDYQSKSVADFNMELLEWADNNPERMARITDDVAYQDFSVDLSNDELSFVTLTTWLSRVENGKHVQSHDTGQAEEDPSYNQYLPLKTAGENGYSSAWCNLYYQFSYHIADKQTLTVGERDEHIGNMLHRIEDYWNKTDMEEMLRTTKDDMVRKLQEIAVEYSDADITITIREDSVWFETMDEQSKVFD